ncbi:hypothetical protein J6590_005314 [Homalodisca vitripennis]|nr:hypothetical protein J6590_005314 [Homalodisca vitripennis]
MKSQTTFLTNEIPGTTKLTQRLACVLYVDIYQMRGIHLSPCSQDHTNGLTPAWLPACRHHGQSGVQEYTSVRAPRITLTALHLPGFPPAGTTDSQECRNTPQSAPRTVRSAGIHLSPCSQDNTNGLTPAWLPACRHHGQSGVQEYTSVRAPRITLTALHLPGFPPAGTTDSQEEEYTSVRAPRITLTALHLPGFPPAGTTDSQECRNTPQSAPRTVRSAGIHLSPCSQDNTNGLTPAWLPACRHHGQSGVQEYTSVRAPRITLTALHLPGFPPAGTKDSQVCRNTPQSGLPLSRQRLLMITRDYNSGLEKWCYTIICSTSIHNCTVFSRP